MNFKTVPQKNFLLPFGCSLLKTRPRLFRLKSVQGSFSVGSPGGMRVVCRVNICAFYKKSSLQECGLHIALGKSINILQLPLDKPSQNLTLQVFLFLCEDKNLSSIYRISQYFHNFTKHSDTCMAKSCCSCIK